MGREKVLRAWFEGRGEKVCVCTRVCVSVGCVVCESKCDFIRKRHESWFLQGEDGQLWETLLAGERDVCVRFCRLGSSHGLSLLSSYSITG